MKITRISSTVVNARMRNWVFVRVVTDVPGLFGWVRPGDLLAIDGSSGTVLVHPSPTDLEKLRRARDAGPREDDPSG